jgi:hypothetical protein
MNKNEQMQTTTSSERVDTLIKARLARILDDSRNSNFLRELIFSGDKQYNWKSVGELIQIHFPEKSMDIQRILDCDLTEDEVLFTNTYKSIALKSLLK